MEFHRYESLKLFIIGNRPNIWGWLIIFSFSNIDKIIKVKEEFSLWIKRETTKNIPIFSKRKNISISIKDWWAVVYDHDDDSKKKEKRNIIN